MRAVLIVLSRSKYPYSGQSLAGLNAFCGLSLRWKTCSVATLADAEASAWSRLLMVKIRTTHTCQPGPSSWPGYRARMESQLRIETVTPANVRAACGLELRPGQEDLVAPVARSLAEAYAAPEIAWPRLVYDGSNLVGFVMAAFAPDHENDIYRAYLWRLNISGTAQHRGYGRFAVAAVAAEASRRGQRRLTVSWHDGPDGPEGFLPKPGLSPDRRRHPGRDRRRAPAQPRVRLWLTWQEIPWPGVGV
jgi:diamine N-acetyltransferase